MAGFQQLNHDKQVGRNPLTFWFEDDADAGYAGLWCLLMMLAGAGEAAW